MVPFPHALAANHSGTWPLTACYIALTAYMLCPSPILYTTYQRPRKMPAKVVE
jgi:hypothetical protein